MNLFLTEDGVLKLGYYGLTTQSKCYSIKKTDCDGIRSFSPEVFGGGYEMKSDVWSLGIALIEMMGMAPYYSLRNDSLPSKVCDDYPPFDEREIESKELIDFLYECFQKKEERWSVSELMNVSVMGWRLMGSIHL